MSASQPPIIVVGAGIVGICCALQLQAEGHPVTVIDPRPPGTGTSFGNAGLIADAMIVPHSTPDLWKHLPWMLFSRMSPMALRWRHLPRALPWMIRFLGQSRASTVRRRAGEVARLNSFAAESHVALIKSHRIDPGLIRPDGTLEMSRHEDLRRSRRLELEILEAHGVRHEIVGADELRQLEPGVSREFRSALFYPDMGYVVQSVSLTEAYTDAFLSLGGTLVTETVCGFEIGPEGPRTVVTDLGRHGVDLLVIAAGAWSARLTRMLGTRVPLDAERGYHISVDWTDGVTLNRPVLDSDNYFVMVPMRDGVRITSGAEMGGLELAPDFTRIYRVLAQARRNINGLDGEVNREWMGHRPSMPDSKPVIGRSPHFARVYFAFGHGHLGLTQSAATAALLSDVVAGREPRIDLAPFSASRF